MSDNIITLDTVDNTSFEDWQVDFDDTSSALANVEQLHVPHMDELFHFESMHSAGDLLPTSPFSATENFVVPEVDVKGVMDLFSGNTPVTKSLPPPSIITYLGISESNNFLSPKTTAAAIQQQPSPRKKIKAANNNTTIKSPRVSPEMSLVRLQYIFKSFSDSETNLLSAKQFMQMMTRHRLKEEIPFTLTLDDPSIPEELFGPNGSDSINIESFCKAFQICNRCTEAKRKASKTSLEFGRGTVLATEVAPVIVRVMPCHFEGKRVKSCEHFQWTWCPGFSVTGNPKCNGTNRHDKCPKYLANCTLWKHRLPPKTKTNAAEEFSASSWKSLQAPLSMPGDMLMTNKRKLEA